MHVEVFLTGSTVSEEHVKDKTVVVIDVLRASATILTALANGARDVVPVADMGTAGKLASNLDPASYVLGGERSGVKIDGYHAGNSPAEYSTEVVEGKTVILNTSNGTSALVKARGAALLLVGSFLNASRIAEVVREAGLDLVIICAGWRDRLALEDTLCAGLILSLLWEGDEPGLVSDAAHTAYSLYHHDAHALDDALGRCNHAMRLRDLDAADDVAYCIRRDALPVIPVFRDSRLRLLSDQPIAAFLPEPAVDNPTDAGASDDAVRVSA